MRFYEIVDTNDNHDMIDYFRNILIIEFDGIYEVIKEISNNFNTPVDWINDFDDLISINRRKLIRIFPELLKTFPDNNNRWNIKLKQLLDYFEINY